MNTRHQPSFPNVPDPPLGHLWSTLSDTRLTSWRLKWSSCVLSSAQTCNAHLVPIGICSAGRTSGGFLLTPGTENVGDWYICLDRWTTYVSMRGHSGEERLSFKVPSLIQDKLLAINGIKRLQKRATDSNVNRLELVPTFGEAVNLT